MKRFLVFSTFVLVVACIIFYQPIIKHYLYYSPCDTPVHYKIGPIDERFNISSQAFRQDTQQAISIWDSVVNKQLFVYDPKATLTISMQFDQRQALNSQINNLHDQLNQEENNLSPQIQAYNQKVADFKKRLADLNQQIDYWNNKGGAPPEEYDKLIAEQNALQQEATEINQMQKDLNLSTQNYNAQVGQLNQAVDTLNSDLQVKPEEGLYNPNNQTITIYFNNGQQELIHTLAHELGHALGMNHETNPDAIMYYQTNTKITPTTEDVQQLEQICQKRSILELIREHIQTYIVTVSKQKSQ